MITLFHDVLTTDRVIGPYMNIQLKVVCKLLLKRYKIYNVYSTIIRYMYIDSE